ncbi:ABC transporter ATP-binding protein [Edaphovirga cremea]|uniref:ABC transporter ATP-binding protein n=1 Tax=Edaphovirga cremea TaxID=2267246 RepID=UPI003988B157
MSAIQITHLKKSFASQPVLNDVTLHINHGEFVAVLGPSGCGKTTLLRLIAGFEPLDQGTICVGERLLSSSEIHILPEKRALGIVFQNYALWPHMSVVEDVEYSLKVAGLDRAERQQRTLDALALVGLTQFSARAPAELSGGQRQRVALARCLVARPSVVLLDEPLANLDVHLRTSMEEEFSRFHRHSGATMLYITHDQQEAMALADRVVVMDKGRVMQFSTPEMLYLEPANAMVARFIADGRVLPVEQIRPDGKGMADVRLFNHPLRLRASSQQPECPQGQISLHAADLRLATATEVGIPSRLTRKVYRGGYQQWDVELESHPEYPLSLNVSDTLRHNIGDSVLLTIIDGWVIPVN